MSYVLGLIEREKREDIVDGSGSSLVASFPPLIVGRCATDLKAALGSRVILASLVA